MRILARSLLTVVLLISLLPGCNAEPAPENDTWPPIETPPEEGAEMTCTYNEVQYPDGFVFGDDGGVARCTSRFNGLCGSGPFTGRSCIVSTDCYATCTHGHWR